MAQTSLESIRKILTAKGRAKVRDMTAIGIPPEAQVASLLDKLMCVAGKEMT
jgi:hypothetical protein